ncbi:hypothetical protein ACFOD4_17885 [Pseudoroseomonas globiformis]|uniref:Uncharacterized protein n=1 Tax=Teichococcus globiformis TaxID=2307229 RepID=A0ABV7G8J1_9PROT
MTIITQNPVQIADVQDAGLVRLGAGMRHLERRAMTMPAGLPPLPPGFRNAPATTGCPHFAAATADAGRVRLGAGMRRG